MAEDPRSMAGTYLKVMAIEAAIIIALYAFGRALS
jgi:hypothetical protein